MGLTSFRSSELKRINGPYLFKVIGLHQRSETVTEELAEETGLHIGDGSMNFYKNKGELKGLYQLRGHMTDDKEHYD